MMKLIKQKKKYPCTATTKSSVCSVRILDLFLWHPILVLALSILGFVGKGAAVLVRQLGVKTAGGFFFVFVFVF
jgi:hypothetical protein